MPHRWMLWAVAAALVTMALKGFAWQLTGSVGLLSDALESLVNLGAAVVGFSMLRLAIQPADSGHQYGHGKAEYLASGFEGALIGVAAISIAWAAWPRLLDPQPIEQPGIGLLIVGVAAGVNGVVALILRRAGRRHRSLALEADAAHLMTDVWTTAAIIVGVGLVAVTDWLILDALIALAVAINILRTGWHLLRESAAGLMDASWPSDERARLDAVLERYRQEGIDFHAIRTRRAGMRSFVSFHVLVPGRWSVQAAHDHVERIEAAIAGEFSPVTVMTHLEPIEDPASHLDTGLDRVDAGSLPHALRE